MLKIKNSLSGWNGYSVEEVDDFLDQVTEELEKKCKELSTSTKEVEQLKKELEHYKGMESTLQNTLVIAQSAADEVKNAAKQQANQIIKDAEGTARQSVETLSQTIVIKKKELEDLDKQLDVYKAKMESLLISQLELIKDMKKD
ncbi:MAG: DivIVA domain-containing protein [Clostridia bacterium]|nr:DivIVA domain-containing protein [Clostridia bacterium]